MVQVDIDAACMHMTSDQGWDWDDLDDDEKGRIRMIMSEYVSAALGQVIG